MISQFSLAFVIASLVRALIAQPFNTPSGSMLPTLLVGDSFYAVKYAYGYNRFSLPFAPSWSGRLFGSRPRLGDVIVFRKGDADYVKRVVGLPGDSIELKDDVLIRDGAPVARRVVTPGFRLRDFMGKPMEAATYEETLGGATYTIVEIDPSKSPLANTGPFRVPEDACFVLGDNRDNSLDSRRPAIGFVPFDHIIGRAAFIFYSAEPGSPGRPGAPRPERIGEWVR